MFFATVYLPSLHRRFARIAAGFLLCSAALCIGVLSTSLVHAQATDVEISSGTLSSNSNTGTKWKSVDFNALTTGDHELTVTWDNATVDLRINVFDDQSGNKIGNSAYTAGEVVWTGALDETGEYRVSIWVVSGGATDHEANLSADVGLPPSIEPVLPDTDTDSAVVIGTGILDSQKVLGPRWVRIDFDALATTTHTITVAWDTGADVRFRVLNTNGTAVSPIINDANPSVWQGELELGDSYYIGLWSTAGSTNYTATVDASTVDASTVDAPAELAITTPPNDQTIDENMDAVFTVETTGGSGALNYQWYADDTVIGGATTDTLTVSSVTVAQSGTNYSVVVMDNNGNIVSEEATLTVVPTATTDGIVAHWKMNESSNAFVINDSSDNGHHGTIGQDVVTGVSDGGATTYRWLFTPPTESYEPGRIVNVPHDSDLNPGTGDYSITMRYSTNVPFGNIIQKGQGGAPGGYWKIENPGGHLTCVFRGVANNGGWNRKEVVSSLPLNDGEYHTITCERIDNKLRLIVDGVLDDTANNSTGSIANDRSISIGGKTNCDNVRISCDYFTGWIDEISIGKP